MTAPDHRPNVVLINCDDLGSAHAANLAIYEALRDGVELEDGFAQCDSARIMQKQPDRTLVELVIHQGRNRIVRRRLAEVGYPVTDLVRTRIGPVHLGQQRPGIVRAITGKELHALYTAVGL